MSTTLRKLCSMFFVISLLLIPTRSIADWKRLNFGGATPNALDEKSVAGTESIDLNCENASWIVLKIEYSAANVTAPLMVALKDHNSDVGRVYSTSFTPLNTGENDDIQETGFFHGESQYIPTTRSKSFRVVLHKAPSNSGTVSVWAKAVSNLSNPPLPTPHNIVTEEEIRSIRTVTGINDDFHVSVNIDGASSDTAFVLIDLNDTVNFPHSNTDHILITWWDVTINPTTAFRGDVFLGYVSGLGDANADINIIKPFHFDQASASLNQFVEYNSSHVSAKTTSSLLDFLENNTLFTTTASLARPGNGTTSPENGDIVMFADITAGAADIGITVGYRTSP